MVGIVTPVDGWRNRGSEKLCELPKVPKSSNSCLLAPVTCVSCSTIVTLSLPWAAIPFLEDKCSCVQPFPAGCSYKGSLCWKSLKNSPLEEGNTTTARSWRLSLRDRDSPGFSHLGVSRAPRCLFFLLSDPSPAVVLRRRGPAYTHTVVRGCVYPTGGSNPKSASGHLCT